MTDPRPAQLRALLLTHQPVGYREAGHLEAMLALLDSPGDSLSRLHFDPGHFTASGFVVSPDRLSVLLVHHIKLGKWLQSGGHVEPGDSNLETAARREVMEETGLEDMDLMGLLDLDVHRFPERGGGPAHDHLDVRFGFLAHSEEAAVGDGTSDVNWFPLAEVAAWDDRPSLSRPAKKLLVIGC
ncbi:MAG: NUDIX domain-containing protein [Acidimicrobiia bacterium]|nr:NUDIX domain-containing protein [Acidimicrobiia bacterium]MDH3396839.1 NUDIX domain-containing protein [Acidimicrobiia bacterium]MDH5614949.1 NUDIX domain-containing protein [Acidimicrobiia bacterium]